MKSIRTDYIQLTGIEEDKRLQMQNQVVSRFDQDVYRKVLGQYDTPVILDVGCGVGDMIYHVIGDTPARVLGFDSMQRQIELAAQRHPQGSFAMMDIEQESFCDTMQQWMEDENICGFDVINCSMILMHLSDPQRALLKLCPLLNEGGTLIVREVDDGLQYAWPDPEGRFKRWSEIIAQDGRFGDRHCGRKVYSYLKNAGFDLIRLEKQGLTNIDLPEGKGMYEMAVPAFLDYIRQRAAADPNNLQYRQAHEWYADNIDGLRKAFDSADFILSFGFMSFTAKRGNTSTEKS